MRRIRLTIAYDGTNFSGWQKQKNGSTIQEEIEKRLSIITNEEIDLHGAGRTDAGVHAEAMVAHFDCPSPVSDANLLRGLNAMLPSAIRIFSVETCPPDFHARFSASGKYYHYHLYSGKIQPPHLRLYSLHITSKLDTYAMRQSLQYLIGTHDFSSFENSGTRDKNATSGRGAVRTIYAANLLIPEKEKIIIEIAGDGFLKNMVRNIVGTLLDVGRRKIDQEEFAKILAAKRRCAAGATAPAHGLFLKKVCYQQSR